MASAAAGLLALQPGLAGSAVGATSSGGCLTSPSTASVIVDDGASSMQLSAEQLCTQESVNAQYYTRAFTSGPAQEDPSISGGIPVDSVLSLAGINPATVTFTAVTRADGSWSTWTAAQAAQPTYGTVGLPAVLRLNGDAVDYNRPLLADPKDVNAGDAVATDPGTPLVITVGQGPLLTVTASADKTSVKVGATVHFTATASPTGEAPTYTWTFGDGTPTVVGSSVTHAFAAAGGFTVLVAANGADQAQGESDAVVMTVGSPQGQPTPTSSPAPSPSSPGPTPSGAPSPGGGRTSGAPGPVASGSATPRPSASGSPKRGALPTLPPLTRVPSVAQGRVVARAPLVAGPPLIRGQLVSEGQVISAASTRAGAQPTAGSATRLTTAGRAWSIAAAVLAILTLIGAGVAREIGWHSHRGRRDEGERP